MLINGKIFYSKGELIDRCLIIDNKDLIYKLKNNIIECHFKGVVFMYNGEIFNVGERMFLFKQ